MDERNSIVAYVPITSRHITQTHTTTHVKIDRPQNGLFHFLVNSFVHFISIDVCILNRCARFIFISSSSMDFFCSQLSLFITKSTNVFARPSEPHTLSPRFWKIIFPVHSFRCQQNNHNEFNELNIFSTKIIYLALWDSAFNMALAIGQMGYATHTMSQVTWKYIIHKNSLRRAFSSFVCGGDSLPDSFALPSKWSQHLFALIIFIRRYA